MQHKPQMSFLSNSFFEIMIDSHTLVRNNAETSPSSSFPTMVTSCKTVIQFIISRVLTSTWIYNGSISVYIFKVHILLHFFLLLSIINMSRFLTEI